MISVDKVNGATHANGALTFVNQVALSLTDNTPAGTLEDVATLSFGILNGDMTVIQVQAPLDAGSSGTDRLGPGRYAAVWNPMDTPVGQYYVRWEYQITNETPKSFLQEFELTAAPYLPNQPHYCTYGDLTDVGRLPSNATPAKVQRWIEKASKLVEMYTGRGPFAFDPQFKIVEVDGSSARSVLLGEPICAIEGVQMTIVSAFGQSNLSIISQALRIYNRHLTANLTRPDDRFSPKLEFIHGDDLNGIGSASTNNTASGYRLDTLVWPRGNKNVQVTGIFGFTEWDGSWVGKTPDMIRRATALLVFRNFVDQCVDDREARQRGYRLIQENTRDQGQQFSQPWLKGWLTGDPEIDQILISFLRPPGMGSC